MKSLFYIIKNTLIGTNMHLQYINTASNLGSEINEQLLRERGDAKFNLGSAKIYFEEDRTNYSRESGEKGSISKGTGSWRPPLQSFSINVFLAPRDHCGFPD